MDVVKENAEKLAAQTGATKVYTELESLLDDKEIDAVIIITPTNLHADQVVKAAQAKKHIYCEKPMTTTIGEADRMISACKENNVKLQIAFMKRFNKSFHLVKQILDEGKLGDIFELRAIWDNARTQTSAQANYRHRLVSGGGYLQEDGSHPIDVCRWFMGDVVEVTGHSMMVAANRFENDDLDLVVMKHKNGGMSSLHITMLTHRRGVESYEIFGTKGTLLMEWQFHSTHSLEPAIIHLYEKSVKKQDLTLYTSWNPHEELIQNWQYLNELRYFCDCIINDKEPEIDGVDGRAIVEMPGREERSSCPWTGHLTLSRFLPSWQNIPNGKFLMRKRGGADTNFFVKRQTSKVKCENDLLSFHISLFTFHIRYENCKSINQRKNRKLSKL